MQEINPFPRDSADHRENIRIYTELFEEALLKPTFYAGDGAVGAGAAFVSGTVGGASTVEFPNAGTPAWRVERRMLSRWRRATVRVTTVYTATVGSTNSFVFELRLREHGDGDVHPTANLLAVSLVLPGPAVANTEMTYVYVSAAATLAGAKTGATFAHQRNSGHASDTNANALHVFRVLWEILPE